MDYFYNSQREQSRIIENTLRDFQVRISVGFLTCAEIQLKKDFEIKTGIALPNKNVVLSTSIFNLTYGEISRYSTSVFVNHEYLFVSVCWNSKSSRIYKMEDEDIDCNDIQFWMEGIDAKLVHQYLHPTYNNPFHLKDKDISFELVITNLAIDMHIELTVKTNIIQSTDEMIAEIDAYIEKYNAKADKSDGKIGAVHSWEKEIIANGIKYHFDLGLSGMTFMPAFLKYLSKMNCFEKVELL